MRIPAGQRAKAALIRSFSPQRRERGGCHLPSHLGLPLSLCSLAGFEIRPSPVSRARPPAESRQAWGCSRWEYLLSQRTGDPRLWESGLEIAVGRKVMTPTASLPSGLRARRPSPVSLAPDSGTWPWERLFISSGLGFFICVVG